MFEPYPYIIDTFSKHYLFKTENDISFVAYFALDKSWFPYNPELFEHTYTFGIYTKPISRLHDARIKPTIAAILMERFNSSKETIITFHCDDSDGRGHLRDRKFNGWHKLLHNEKIVKSDRRVIFDNDLVFTSILIHKDNSRFNRIMGMYHAGDDDVTDKFQA